MIVIKNTALSRFVKLRYLVLIVIALCVFGDTLFLHYTSDDRMIIFENEYTLQGFSGVPSVLTKDAFTGYFGEKSQLVVGGRYRPLSQLTFIIEYELFGGSIHSQVGGRQAPENEGIFSNSIMPIVQHTNNLLLFIVLCISLYSLLSHIFPQYESEKWFYSLPFLTTLLFLLHPIHTEVIANIKGRDEILCMLFSVWTLYAIIRFVKSHHYGWLCVSFFTFVFALFSKENAITFLAIAPLAIFYISDKQLTKNYLLSFLPLIVGSAVFLIARYHAIGWGTSMDTVTEILNNPFIHATKLQEIATVLFTWGIYFRLLIFPHPLTHDYYPHQIAITDFANPLVWVVVIIVIFLLIYAIKQLKHKSVLTFGILFFMITFSITSNLLFNVGTFMNERFMFMPSLGFLLIVTFLLQKMMTQTSFTKGWVAIILVICGLLGVKTVTRNLVWYDDFTLFTTDVKTSTESIKCNVSAGGSYLSKYIAQHKQKDLTLAEKYLHKAKKLGANNIDFYTLLASVYFHEEKYDQAEQCYAIILNNYPDHELTIKNLEAVRKQKSANMLKYINDLFTEGKKEEALRIAQEQVNLHPESAELYNVLGRIYGEGFGRIDDAIICLEKSVSLDMTLSSPAENLGIAYALKGRYAEAEASLQRAHALDPENQSIIHNLEIVQKNR